MDFDQYKIPHTASSTTQLQTYNHNSDGVHLQPPIISVSAYMEMSGEKQEEAFHPLIAWEVCADPLVQLFSCKTPS